MDADQQWKLGELHGEVSALQHVLDAIGNARKRCRTGFPPSAPGSAPIASDALASLEEEVIRMRRDKSAALERLSNDIRIHRGFAEAGRCNSAAGHSAAYREAVELTTRRLDEMFEKEAAEKKAAHEKAMEKKAAEEQAVREVREWMASEKAKRQAAAREAGEKAAREVQEKAAREAQQKAAREAQQKAAREAREKAVREVQERRAAREKVAAEKVAAEKVAAEKAAAEKAASEKAASEKAASEKAASEKAAAERKAEAQVRIVMPEQGFHGDHVVFEVSFPHTPTPLTITVRLCKNFAIGEALTCTVHVDSGCDTAEYKVHRVAVVRKSGVKRPRADDVKKEEEEARSAPAPGAPAAAASDRNGNAAQISRILGFGAASSLNKAAACRVLQIEPTADPASVKTAYRRLARVVHPDKNADSEETARRAFQLLQEAYDKARGRA